MAKKKILVVDSDLNLAKFLLTVLENEGYAVATVESLDRAIATLPEACFDLIITEAFGQTDIFQFNPDFLEDLREMAPNVPIVLCTVAPAADSLRAGGYGLADVITKPFDIDVLVTKIKQALRRRNGEGS